MTMCKQVKIHINLIILINIFYANLQKKLQYFHNITKKFKF